MVNVEDFIKRLEIILDYYNLSASAFADKISVQRSSLSHLLSGRNKPSLDFIIKVIEVFPEVDLYWILNGKGTFPKSEAINLLDEVKTAPAEVPLVQTKLDSPDLFSATATIKNDNEIQPTEINHHSPAAVSSNNIERIVIFYKDGTFKNYNP